MTLERGVAHNYTIVLLRQVWLRAGHANEPDQARNRDLSETKCQAINPSSNQLK